MKIEDIRYYFPLKDYVGPHHSIVGAQELARFVKPGDFIWERNLVEESRLPRLGIITKEGMPNWRGDDTHVGVNLVEVKGRLTPELLESARITTNFAHFMTLEVVPLLDEQIRLLEAKLKE